VCDQVDGRWRPAAAEDARPGAVLLLRAEDGGYLADEGWSPKDNAVVDPVTVVVDLAPLER
jgi:CRISPR-associated endonuclease/helicase Cas3